MLPNLLPRRDCPVQWAARLGGRKPHSPISAARHRGLQADPAPSDAWPAAHQASAQAIIEGRLQWWKDDRQPPMREPTDGNKHREGLTYFNRGSNHRRPCPCSRSPPRPSTRPRAAPRVQGAALVLLNWGAKLRGPNLITLGNQPNCPPSISQKVQTILDIPYTLYEMGGAPETDMLPHACCGVSSEVTVVSLWSRWERW